MYLKLKYLFIFLCFLVFLSKAQGTPKDLYQLLVRVEQTFGYLFKEKGKKLEKEGHWHPWLGRTCAVVLLKNGKQTGSVLYIANYDCEPKHCWFYFVEEPNGKSSWSRFLKNNDIAKRRYYGFQNEKACKYFWNFIKKLNLERMIFRPVGEKSKMQRR